MEKLVSIIVPVYNVEGCIGNCINSIINQNYKNLEIIIINDGSTDNSGVICDSLATTDSRIKVIHQNNSGISNVRNTGLNIATGDYVSFIDGDDYVSPMFIEILVRNMEDNDCDVSCCDFRCTNSLNDVDLNNHQNIKLYNSYTALEELLYQKGLDNSLCWKLFKKELFNDIKFPDDMIFEDYAVIYKVFLKIKKLVKSDLKLYYYYQHNSSITNRKFSYKNFDIIKISEGMVKDIVSKQPKLESAAKCRVLSAYYYLLRKIDKVEYKNEYKNIKRYIKNNRFIILKDKKIKTKMRIAIIISYINIDLIRVFYNLKIIKSLIYMR